MKDNTDTDRPNWVIPFGGAKLLLVLALDATLCYIAGWWNAGAAVVAGFLVIQAASQFTSQGWAIWLREYYYRDVRATLLWVHINKDGVVEQKIFPYTVGARADLKKTRLRPGTDPSICIVLSGWRLLFFFWRWDWVEYNENRRVAHWKIIPQWSYIGDAKNERRTWGDGQAPRLKSVQLAESSGITYVELSLEDAIHAMRRLTKLGQGERSCLPHEYVVGFTPFSELLAGVLTTSNATSVAKTGTGSDEPASPESAASSPEKSGPTLVGPPPDDPK